MNSEALSRSDSDGRWTASDETDLRRPAPDDPVVLDRVTMRWPKQPKPVLDEVDLRLTAGSLTWIGGENGVGKTTLLTEV